MPLTLLLTVTAFSLNLGVANAQDMLSPTRDLTRTAATGSFEDRDTADRLYQESKHHEHEFREHHDHGAWAKALREARQAFAADMQAQELARTALQGLKSESLQQNQFAAGSAANDINVPALEAIASQPSSYAAEAAQTFAGYGYSLGPDQATASTASGVANSTTGSTAATTLALGRSPASVSGSLNATQGAFLEKSTSPTGTGAELQKAAAKKDLLPSELNTDPKAAPLDPLAAKKQAALDAKANLEHNRALISRQIGLSSGAANDGGPIRTKNEDIFQVVHTHYSSLRDQGIFYETSPPADSPGPSETPPAFSRGF